jgi:hypothetical protein
MKLDLLTNATVVDDAIRFISFNRSKDNEDTQENKRQEEEMGEEITSATVNNVF